MLTFSPVAKVPAVSGNPDVAVAPAFAEVLLTPTVRLSEYDYRTDIFYSIGLSIIVQKYNYRIIETIKTSLTPSSAINLNWQKEKFADQTVYRCGSIDSMFDPPSVVIRQ